MKRLTYLLVAAFVGGGLLALDPAAQASKTAARPLQTVVNVPASQSVYLDVPFDAGRAIATISANNNQTLMQVYIYDTDGHVASGVGFSYPKTATMNVYRAGTFRIQIQNYGTYDGTVVLTTN